MSSYLNKQIYFLFTKTSNPTQNSEYQYSQIINLGLFLQDLIPPSSQSLLLYRANAYYWPHIVVSFRNDCISLLKNMQCYSFLLSFTPWQSLAGLSVPPIHCPGTCANNDCVPGKLHQWAHLLTGLKVLQKKFKTNTPRALLLTKKM